jgi:predicted Zn-dependent peptidase
MNRQIAPEIKNINSLKTGFPVIEKKLLRIPSEEGVFKLDIIFPNSGFGMFHDKFAALYSMDLLLSGTSKKSADEIAESIDLLGGYVFKSCDYYQSSISIYGLEEQLERLIQVVKESYENCIYLEHELNHHKTRKISDLNINLNKTSYLAGRGLNALLFGKNHPFSKAIDESTIHSITREQLLEFKTNRLLNPYFIYTGSKSSKIESILNGLAYETNQSIELDTEDNRDFDGNGESFILKEGSTQNSLRLGKFLPSRQDDDYFKISMFNLILGGYFGSRLMKNIREEKGLTYGIHSSITPFKTYSVFKISSECNSDLTPLVKEEIVKEIELLQRELVGEEEMSTAKNYMLGNMLRNFDGAFNISDRLKSSLELGTKEADKYFQSYFRAIHEINAEDIKKIANNYFKIETLKDCISGEV